MNKLFPIVLALIISSLMLSVDRLVLLDDSTHIGEFITFQGDNIIFKPAGSTVGQSLNIMMVKSLTLSDGTIVPIKIPSNYNMYLAGKKLKSASNKMLIATFLPFLTTIILTQIKRNPEILITSGVISSFILGLWAIFDLGEAGDLLEEGSGEVPNNE